MQIWSEINIFLATKLWLNKKCHHNKAHSGATKQRWFQGVYPDAEKDEGNDYKVKLQSKIPF